MGAVILEKTKNRRQCRRVVSGAARVVPEDRTWKKKHETFRMGKRGLVRGKKYVSRYEYMAGAVHARLGRFAYVWGATDNRCGEGDNGTLRVASPKDAEKIEALKAAMEAAQVAYYKAISDSWRRAKPIPWAAAEEVIRDAGFEVKVHTGDAEPV